MVGLVGTTGKRQLTSETLGTVGIEASAFQVPSSAPSGVPVDGKMRCCSTAPCSRLRYEDASCTLPVDCRSTDTRKITPSTPSKPCSRVMPVEAAAAPSEVPKPLPHPPPPPPPPWAPVSLPAAARLLPFMTITPGRVGPSDAPPILVSWMLPMLSWPREPAPMMVCRATRTARPAEGVPSTSAALPPSRNTVTVRLRVPGSGRGTRIVNVGDGVGEKEEVEDVVVEPLWVGVSEGVGVKVAGGVKVGVPDAVAEAVPVKEGEALAVPEEEAVRLGVGEVLGVLGGVLEAEGEAEAETPRVRVEVGVGVPVPLPVPVPVPVSVPVGVLDRESVEVGVGDVVGAAVELGVPVTVGVGVRVGLGVGRGVALAEMAQGTHVSPLCEYPAR